MATTGFTPDFVPMPENKPKRGWSFWRHLRHLFVCEVFDFRKSLVIGHPDLNVRVVQCERCGYAWLEKYVEAK